MNDGNDEQRKRLVYGGIRYQPVIFVEYGDSEVVESAVLCPECGAVLMEVAGVYSCGCGFNTETLKGLPERAKTRTTAEFANTLKFGGVYVA